VTKSPEIKNLALALAAFQGEMKPVKKDSENPYFHSKYADLGTIIESVRPLLTKHGLSFVQFPSGEYQLTTIILHVSGEWIEDTFTMKPVDNKPQSIGSMLTYARRYALGAVLGIATEEDDDGNAASAVGEKKKQAQTRPLRGAAKSSNAGDTAINTSAICQCTACGVSLSPAVADFSQKRYGTPLCLPDQKQQLDKSEPF